MNFTILFGIIFFFLGFVGVWASKVRFPVAPFYFPRGSVFGLTRAGFSVMIFGGLLISWGLIDKIPSTTISIMLKVFVLLLAIWISYRFYLGNTWSLSTFFPI